MMNSLDLSFDILRCVGIFPLRNPSKYVLFLFNIYRMIMFVLISSLTILMTIQLIVATDLSLLARTIDIWTMFVSGFYKWCYMTLFNKDFAKLKTMMAQIQAESSAEHEKSADYFIANYTKRTRRVTVWYIFSGFIAVIFMFLNSVIIFFKSDQSNVIKYNDSRCYPLSCWMPFTIKEDWMFLIIFTLHSITLMHVVFIYLGIDAYMFGTLFAAGSQIDLLCIHLLKIDNVLTESDDSLSINLRYMKFEERHQNQLSSNVRQCIIQHNAILKCIKNVGTHFSSLIIVDYLHAITSLSFALFQLMISVEPGEIISVFGFFFVSFWHQFLNNYFGEYIVQKQLKIRIFAYRTPWLLANKDIRHKLTLMILRSQNPIFIKGFYMYKLCNQSFISFVKALYSFYMVLRRINLEVKNPRGHEA